MSILLHQKFFVAPTLHARKKWLISNTPACFIFFFSFPASCSAPYPLACMLRGGQNPPDPTNPSRPDPDGFCAFFLGYGLKFPKSARIGSGLGFNKKIYADTRCAPFLPAIPPTLNQPLKCLRSSSLIFDFEQQSLTHLARSRETLNQSSSLFSTTWLEASHSQSLDLSLSSHSR
jgi:hypothetical protein